MPVRDSAELYREPIMRMLAVRSSKPLRTLAKRIHSSPTGYRLAKGAFWSVIGAFISRGLTLLGMILVARVLGARGFGELGVVQTTVGMLLVFAAFGMGLTATKYIAQFRISNPEKVGRIIALANVVAVGSGAIMTTALVMLAPWLATNILAAPQLAHILQIGSVLLLLSTWTGVQTGCLVGFEAFKKMAQVNLYVGLISIPILLAGAYWGGLQGAVLGLVAGMGISGLLNHIALRGEVLNAGISVQWGNFIQEWRVLPEFSFPTVLAGAVVAPMTWVCSVILVNQPNGYIEMGIFNAANQWYAAILFLPTYLGAIVLPVLVSNKEKDKRARYINILRYNILLNFFLTLFIAVVIALCSKYILLSYGSAFEKGYWVLVILSFAAVLNATVAVIGQAIASRGRMWWGFGLNLLWAVMLLSVAWQLRSYGAEGIAIATLAAYIFHLFSVSSYGYLDIYRRNNDSL